MDEQARPSWSRHRERRLRRDHRRPPEGLWGRISTADHAL